MNQEEKKLLLIDLCARLPYDNTYVQYTGDVPTGLGAVKLNHEIIKIIEALPEELNIIIKPYLRPMSSMTEEEKEFINNIVGKTKDCCGIPRNCIWLSEAEDIIDFYNSHRFDYRGLIEKGLAIDLSKNKIYIPNEKI